MWACNGGRGRATERDEETTFGWTAVPRVSDDRPHGRAHASRDCRRWIITGEIIVNRKYPKPPSRRNLSRGSIHGAHARTQIQSRERLVGGEGRFLVSDASSGTRLRDHSVRDRRQTFEEQWSSLDPGTGPPSVFVGLESVFSRRSDYNPSGGRGGDGKTEVVTRRAAAWGGGCLDGKRVFFFVACPGIETASRSNHVQ